MDDAMIDLLADDGGLRRRLDAFAEARLSPELAASTRMRARVLAVAHRQAALAHADGALSVVSPADAVGRMERGHGTARSVPAARRHRRTIRGIASVVLAAALAISLAVGTTLAARPGGALYGARLWAETLTLPSDERERVLAELERLEARLVESALAAGQGDLDGVEAALLAYETIVAQATADAIAAGDPVGLAALESGIGQDIDVLEALAGRLPDHAAAAVERAVDRAVARAETSVRDIKDHPAAGGPPDAPGSNGGGGNGGAGGNGGNGGNGADPGADGGEPRVTPPPPRMPTPRPTPSPTPALSPAPTPAPTKTPKPTPTPTPTATPAPVSTPKATPTAKPTKAPRATPLPPAPPSPEVAPARPGAPTDGPGKPAADTQGKPELAAPGAPED